MLNIRVATDRDAASIWAILEPTIRAGEEFTYPRDMARADALDAWFAPAHHVFVAEEDDKTLGSYFIRANQPGGGAHVANAAYLTAEAARGRGIARAMCAHSLTEAAARGFRAMQFNIVVGTNAPAVHLWTSLGFTTIGRLPGAFAHPRYGDVDALVMYRKLP